MTMSQVVQQIYEFREEYLQESTIWILRDYNNFHGRPGDQGARRYLYYDGRVEDFGN
jgi:hypothetical protein